MKRADLFHPQIFSDQEWAEGYYKRNAKNIERVGKRFVQLLKSSGFEKGKILDTGCGFGAVAIKIAQSLNDVEIVGIDLGKPLLKLGQSLAEKSGGHGTTRGKGQPLQGTRCPQERRSIHRPGRTGSGLGRQRRSLGCALQDRQTAVAGQ